MGELLPNIRATRVETERLVVNVLSVLGRSGRPVVFVHGNVSSSLFWQQAMLDLPAHTQPLAVDLRGFGATDALPVDATRGVRDYADDIGGLLDTLALDHVDLVGWSMGGGVVLQVLRDTPDRVRTVTLVNPVSPYGFGGTKGAGGELVRPDGTGSGGGAVNPEFVQRLSKADRTVASQASPRQVFRTYYVKPPFRPAPEDEDRYLTAMLSTKVDDDHYPGDATVSEHWPYVAPGKRGVLNAMAPTYLRIDDLHTIDPKPPICWIRGSHDQIVADESIFDFAVLGTFGAIPGWPGAAEFPPQPMLVQTRAVLDRYAAAGGRYIETVIPDTGHSPQIERPMEFAAALRDSLAAG